MEAALAGVAVAGGWLFHQPVLADFHWSLPAAALGAVAAIPPLLLFYGLLRSTWRPLMEIRQWFRVVLRPLVCRWSVAQLAVVSILAGIGEELLFRGLVQGGLTRLLGPVLAVSIASLLFGLVHWVNAAYAVLAGLIGVYLGVEWLLSGNLLAPILTHGIYDFLALLYYLRMHREFTSD